MRVTCPELYGYATVYLGVCICVVIYWEYKMRIDHEVWTDRIIEDDPTRKVTLCRQETNQLC